MNETPKKRRWWFYAGLALLSAAVLAGAAIAVAVAYANYLIRTYTETEPRPVPHVRIWPEAQERLKTRWTDFQETLDSGKHAPPFELSADDLNVFLSNFPALRDRLYLRIVGDRLQGQFCLPLDKTGQRKLQGRHLNGVATFHLVFEDGLVTLTVAAVEANHKPIPHWLLARLQRRNLLQNLDENFQIVELLQKLDTVQVKDQRITLTPTATP